MKFSSEKKLYWNCHNGFRCAKQTTIFTFIRKVFMVKLANLGNLIVGILKWTSILQWHFSVRKERIRDERKISKVESIWMSPRLRFVSAACFVTSNTQHNGQYNATSNIRQSVEHKRHCICCVLFISSYGTRKRKRRLYASTVLSVAMGKKQQQPTTSNEMSERECVRGTERERAC